MTQKRPVLGGREKSSSPCRIPELCRQRYSQPPTV